MIYEEYKHVVSKSDYNLLLKNNVQLPASPQSFKLQTFIDLVIKQERLFCIRGRSSRDYHKVMGVLQEIKFQFQHPDGGYNRVPNDIQYRNMLK